MTAAVCLDHGSGGVLSAQLVGRIVSLLGDRHVGALEDATELTLPARRIAMTTDSFVVDPIFFNGGDIGKVAVCGTVNDLAMSGATPAYLSLALVIEDGFPLADLDRIVVSVREQAAAADVHIACGDTKVVPAKTLDKIMLNTAGVGYFGEGSGRLCPARISAGDAIIVTGHVGDHGVQILSMRNGLGYETRVPSDCASLSGMMRMLSDACGEAVHCARDLTRGGMATALAELADACGRGFQLRRAAVPVRRETRMACDMLDVHPYHLANEGCAALFVAGEQAEHALRVLRSNAVSAHAAIVGVVTESRESIVLELDESGRSTKIESLQGRVLPRLC